jgi:acid phosphatase
MFWILPILGAAIATAVLWAYLRLPRPHLAPTIECRSRKEGEVTILVVGDLGDVPGAVSAQVEVADLMARIASSEAVDAVFLAGDNFHNHGVRDVDDCLWQERFHRVYTRGELASIPFFAVLGNHDYCGNPQAQLDYSMLAPGRWNMPARHYSVRWGKLLEVGCIDTNFPDRSGFFPLPLDRLERRLRRSTAHWKLVVGHRPIFSGGIYRKVQPHLRWIFEAFLRRSGSVLYLSGHDHAMQHLEFSSMVGGSIVRQLVVGSGGSKLRPVEYLANKTRFALSRHGVARIVIRDGVLRCSLFAVDEQHPVYEFSIER